MAFATGRGEQLPRLEEPLSVINGAVRPPATYLSAEEILQRQYVAHLVDVFARDANRKHPRRAKGAIGSAGPGTFLGDLIEYAEGDAAAHLDRFLGTFTGLSAAAVAAVRAWATPSDGPGTSGLAAHLFAASLRWSATVEELSHRRAAIEAALPDLKVRSELPAASEEDTRAYRSARASRKLINAQLGDLRGREYAQMEAKKTGKNRIVPSSSCFDASGKKSLEVFRIHAGPETRERRDIQIPELSLQAESGEDRPGPLDRSRSQAGFQRLNGNGAILPGHRDPGTDGERNIPNLQRAVQRHVPFADRNEHVLQRGRKMLRRHADVPEPDRPDRDGTGSSASSKFRQDRKQSVAVDPPSFKGDRVYRHFPRQKRHQSRT
ncbi:MAG: hypothetical protein EOM10_16550, partial [Opitutae bacterium]|nr:hypothetical protein [Opitutae bacterium]